MEATSDVDQNLYSRQIGVFGMETMGKLIKMDVLIVGMKGLGLETAKNLILAGPRSVSVFDPSPVEIRDLGSNYYLSRQHVGKPRASCVVEKLAELNTYVRVSEIEELKEETLANFHVVVFTNTPRDQLLRYNEFCRSQSPPIAFISSDIRGAAGFIFSDFGEEHIVHDWNGEQCRTAIVTGISNDEAGVVVTHDGKRHQFDDGDHVVFHEVGGMAEVNDQEPMRISQVKPYSFTIGDTRSFGTYTNGGVVEQVKVPKKVAYSSLRKCVLCPVPEDGMMITPDFGKFGRSEQLHIAFQGLQAFEAKHGHLPVPNSAEQAEAVVELAKEFLEQAKKAYLENGADLEEKHRLPVEEVDEDVVRKFALVADTELSPLSSFFGGAVAQEVVKFTGKFSPLNQWVYVDFFEILPEERPSPEETAPRGCRYDDQIAVFGNSFQDTLRKQKMFLVGAGALGCELLKGFAMMGIGCSPEGKLYVTDMDNIETSNLNRQFLFRQEDINKAKSVTACNAAKKMNPEMTVEPMEIAVGPDTEDVLNEAFWDSLDFVTNALDNVKARTYVDGRCVFHQLPLLESGTLGTKANTQVVLPHLTESYSDSQDPPEESIPMCTLKNFPHAIEHCIEWARDLFEGSFTSNVQDAVTFCADPADYLRKLSSDGNEHVQKEKLRGIDTLLKRSFSGSFGDCITAARLLFHDLFYVQICQLLHNFPPDYRDSNGAQFWSGPKRPPSPLEFDPSDATHVSFVMHAACLFAFCLDLSPPKEALTLEAVGSLAAAVAVPKFVPRRVHIALPGEAETSHVEEGDGEIIAALSTQLMRHSPETLSAVKLQAVSFEKDDDANHHIDFIACAANLRARNYKINESPRHKVKMIAGKIIPAIATTTCAVTGLVELELYKLLQKKPFESFRNSFFNLALNIFSMSEPMPPKKVSSTDFDIMMGGPVRAVPEGWTTWDKVIVKEGRDLTVAELVDWIKDKYGVTATMITEETGKCLFAPLLFPAHRERLNDKLFELFRTGQEGLDMGGKKYLRLEVGCEDSSFTDVLIPPVLYYFTQ